MFLFTELKLSVLLLVPIDQQCCKLIALRTQTVLTHFCDAVQYPSKNSESVGG